jgi:hypothetical protein
LYINPVIYNYFNYKKNYIKTVMFHSIEIQTVIKMTIIICYTIMKKLLTQSLNFVFEIVLNINISTTKRLEINNNHSEIYFFILK